MAAHPGRHHGAVSTLSRRLLLGLFAGLLLTGCADPVARCAEANEARDHARAVVSCAEAFETSGDPKTGTRWLRAAYALGRHDEAERAARRLLDGPEAANAWRMLGRLSERQGEGAAAREAFKRARTLHTAAGELKELPYDLHALAGSHWREGHYVQALEALHDTELAAVAVGDDRMHGFALLGLGSLLNQVGDREAAERSFTQAEEKMGALTAEDRVNLRIEHAILQLETDRPALARAGFEQALAEARALKHVRFERVALTNLARASLALGTAADLARARTEVEGARALLGTDPDRLESTFLHQLRAQIARALGDPETARAAVAEGLSLEPVDEHRWRLEYERARIALDAGDAAEALGALQRSIETVESLRKRAGVEELKASFLAAKRAPYEALFRLHVARGETLRALEVADRALARAFLDRLLTGAEPTAEGSSAPLPYERARERAATLTELLPTLSRTVFAQPLTGAELLDGLRGLEVAIYFEAEDVAYLLRLGEGPPRVVQLGTGAGRIAELADAMLAALDDPAPARALGDALLAPGVLPPPGRALHFVPSGALVRTPLAALRPGGRLLLDRNVVVQAPSPSALAIQRRREAEAAAEHRTWGQAVVLADALGDLPFAAAEARSVGRRLGVEPMLRERATAAALRTSAGARLLHLATHTGLGPAGPWIALADGRISATRVLEQGISPRLAVLASCASAATRGGELQGSLASALLAGGAHNVVATLRSVPDDVAREVVERFYAEEGVDRPATALHKVQRALARTRPPSVWADFVILGIGDP